jgi:hydroxyacylglutathione hydrolase
VETRTIRQAAELWDTTALLLVHGSDAVAVDPGVSEAEAAALRDRAAAEGARVGWLLITHSDWDHVSGIATFPDAETAMGETAARRVESGEAAASLVSEGGAYGLEFRGQPRCDRVLQAGRAARVGPFTVETMALTGHTDCGLGYRVRELGALIVGDHLSPIEFPFVYHSTAAYRATLAALVDLLRHDPPTVVYPGHGGPLDAATALRIAEEDLDYLHRLRGAVAGALAAGAAPAEAEAAGQAVRPPRAISPDVEPLAAGNARHQVEELLAWDS